MNVSIVACQYSSVNELHFLRPEIDGIVNTMRHTHRQNNDGHGATSLPLLSPPQNGSAPPKQQEIWGVL